MVLGNARVERLAGLGTRRWRAEVDTAQPRRFTGAAATNLSAPGRRTRTRVGIHISTRSTRGTRERVLGRRSWLALRFSRAARQDHRDGDGKQAVATVRRGPPLGSSRQLGVCGSGQSLVSTIRIVARAAKVEVGAPISRRIHVTRIVAGWRCLQFGEARRLIQEVVATADGRVLKDVLIGGMPIPARRKGAVSAHSRERVVGGNVVVNLAAKIDRAGRVANAAAIVD